MSWSVVGCTECRNPFLLSDERRRDNETVECPSCGHRHATDDLRALAQHDEKTGAAELRARILAARAGESDRYEAMADYAEQADQVDAQIEAATLPADDMDLTPIASDWYADAVDSTYIAGRDMFATAAKDAVGVYDDVFEAEVTSEVDDYQLYESEVDARLEEWTNHDDAEPPAAAEDAGLELTVGGQTELAEIECRGVTPRVSDWLPELLEDLLPHASNTVREHVEETYGADALDERRVPGTYDREFLVSTLGVTGLDGAYAGLLRRWAVEYHDSHPNRHGHRPHVAEELKQRLTNLGTGTDATNSGVDVLEDTVAAVFRHVAPAVDERRPRVRVYLDAEAWQDLEDSRRAKPTLEALSALSTGLNIELVVTSRDLARTLAKRHSDFLETECGLTDLRDWFGRHALDQDDVEADVRDIAADALATLDDQGGRVQLLAALRDADAKSMKQLKRDSAVSVAAGTVDRYVPELQQTGLVSVDRHTGASNRVSLTPAGEVVVEHIADDLSLRDPSQASFRAALLQPLTSEQVQCTERDKVERGEDPSGPPEGWLTATGEAGAGDDAADFVQWLGGPDEQMDAWGMHQRLSAAFQVDGVNCVDERIGALEDGRVSYISCFDSELLTVAQWGGPLVTLARLANALLSREALSKVLGADTVGTQWQDLYDDLDVQELDADLEDLMRWGSQIGWFGEDELEWEGFFDRIGGVRARCMGKLGSIPKDDTEQRTELFDDLHGLVATATALYDAAGVDVQIMLRIPDMATLLGEEYHIRGFLQFLAKTVPKQAMYGSPTGRHSWWRTCVEDRENRLQKRLPVGYQEHAPEAELTASWAIVGPTATDLVEDIEAAIGNEIHELRDRITDRVEAAPVLDVEVANACSHPHLKRVVSEYAGMKNYKTVAEADLKYHTDVNRHLGQLTRLLTRFFATADRPGQAPPTDVAESLLRIARTDKNGDYLGVGDIEYAVSAMPATRVLPDKQPSQTAMFQAIVAADGPIGRSDIVEDAGISGSTYDRHIDDVRQEFGSLDLLEEHSVEGHRRYSATITPWWDAEFGGEKPEDSGIVTIGETEARDILFELATTLDIDIDPELFHRDTPIDEVYAADPALRRWEGFIEAIVGDGTRGDTPPPSTTVTLGVYPKEPPGEQLSLEQSSSETSRTSTPAMPSYPNHSRSESTDGAGEGLE
jgi:DNA-binding MarR family transcriptional regulator